MHFSELRQPGKAFDFFQHGSNSNSDQDNHQEFDSNWIHTKLPPSLVMSMSMLKNGGFQMTTPTIEAASAISKPMVLNRNALAGESSLDIKLATLRHEMVSFNFEAQMKEN